MLIKDVTAMYVEQKREMLTISKIELLKHFNEMFSTSPAITGVMWTQCIGGEGWDRTAMVGEMQLTTDEDPINAAYTDLNLYPETEEQYQEDIDYDYINNIFLDFAANYQDSEELLTDMFPYRNGIKIIVTREGFHTEDYVYSN